MMTCKTCLLFLSVRRETIEKMKRWAAGFLKPEGCKWERRLGADRRAAASLFVNLCCGSEVRLTE